MGVEIEPANDTSEIEVVLRLYNELSDSQKKQFILVLLSLANSEDN